jgi:hypothetical protein
LGENNLASWLILGYFVVILLRLCFVVSDYIKSEMRQKAQEVKTEIDRLARVKALYPKPPSYEERTGSNYGPKKDDDDD